MIAGFQFIHVHFIRNIFWNNSGKNPHKHLAHKVINKDLGIDLNIWLKHLLKRNKRRMWNLNPSSDMVSSVQGDRCVCVCYVTANIRGEGDTPPSTAWLHHNVGYLHLGLRHLRSRSCSRSSWLSHCKPAQSALTCRLLPKMKRARVLLAHVSWHCRYSPSDP